MVNENAPGAPFQPILDRPRRRRHAAELTPREVEIAARVAEGLSNQQIADRLFVAEGTVRTHLHHIFEKLGIHSRIKLALYALREGWAPLDLSHAEIRGRLIERRPG